jgi:predicted NBD/HSP70 family sugar kinase
MRFRPDTLLTRRMNPVAMKSFNAIELLELVRQQGRISRSGLAALSRLSKPTVSDQVDALMAKGLVSEVGTGAASARGGKKPTLLEFNAGYGRIICVDVGSEVIRFALADLASVRHFEMQRPTNPEQGVRSVLRSMKRGIADLLARSSAVQTKLQVISVAVPGIVDVPQGVVIEADNIFGWRDFHLGEELSSAFDLPLYLDNDVNMAALAELNYGDGSIPASFVLIRLDTGIGAGIVLDGKLYHGTHFAAGEIGHMVLDASAAAGPANRRGYLESIVGGDRVLDRVRAIQRRTSSNREVMAGRTDWAAVDTLVRGKHPAGRALFDELVLHLGSAVANIAAAFDPGAVILHGPAFESLLDPLVQITRKLLPWPVNVRLSSLGPDAALQGALAAGISTAFQQIGHMLQTGGEQSTVHRQIQFAAAATGQRR